MSRADDSIQNADLLLRHLSVCPGRSLDANGAGLLAARLLLVSDNIESSLSELRRLNPSLPLASLEEARRALRYEIFQTLSLMSM